MIERHKKILFFQMDLAGLSVGQLRRFCRKLSLEAVFPDREDYTQKLGFLAGTIGFERMNGVWKGPDMEAPMMVFSGISSQELDIVLAAWKKENFPVISCKAMITPVNVSWTPVRLFEELSRENKAMHS